MVNKKSKCQGLPITVSDEKKLGRLNFDGIKPNS